MKFILFSLFSLFVFTASAQVVTEVYHVSGEDTIWGRGKYVDSLREGKWEFYYNRGEGFVSKGKYLKGKRNGEWKEAGSVFSDDVFDRDWNRHSLPVSPDIIPPDDVRRCRSDISMDDFIKMSDTAAYKFRCGSYKKGKYLDGLREGDWIFYAEKKQGSFSGI
ncbi:MAG: hypothetical protein ACKOXB_07875 [Flavobacteriales bacterium]